MRRLGLVGGGVLVLALAAIVSASASARDRVKHLRAHAASLADLIGVDCFHDCDFTHRAA